MEINFLKSEQKNPMRPSHLLVDFLIYGYTFYVVELFGQFGSCSSL